MENKENTQPDINDQSAVVSENNMKKITGGTYDPELWTDGRYHVQCDRCGVWIVGSSRTDCLKRLSFHWNGECDYSVII